MQRWSFESVPEISLPPCTCERTVNFLLVSWRFLIWLKTKVLILTPSFRHFLTLLSVLSHSLTLYSATPSLIPSPAPSLFHSFTSSLPHSLTPSLPLSRTSLLPKPSLLHSLISLPSLTHSLPSSLPYSLNNSLLHSLTPLFPHFVTPSLSHTLTTLLPHSICLSHSHSITTSLSQYLAPWLTHSLTPFYPLKEEKSWPLIIGWLCRGGNLEASHFPHTSFFTGGIKVRKSPVLGKRKILFYIGQSSIIFFMLILQSL
jgi:hypothetical protein